MSEETIETNTPAPQIEIPTGDASPAPVETFQMPEKFQGKSAEEIAKSYVELEKYKATQTETTPSAPSTDSDPTANPESGDKDPLQIEKPEEVTFDQAVETYAQKYLDNEQRFTEEDYKEMNDKFGWSKGIVDQYIRGQVAQAEQQQASVTKVLGGEESTQEIMSWAGENLSKTEIETMNQQLRENPEIGAQMLKLKYEAMVPQSGELLRGNGLPANHADVYHSMDEVMNAMNHAEYNKGGAYDLKHKAKIERSIKAGKLG